VTIYFSAQGDYTINLFSVNGKRVKVLHQEKQWDGRDESGRLCEGGLYIYQIHSGGQVYSGTLVLL